MQHAMFISIMNIGTYTRYSSTLLSLNKIKKQVPSKGITENKNYNVYSALHYTYISGKNGTGVIIHSPIYLLKFLPK
jgi:hypothetical protein